MVFGRRICDFLPCNLLTLHLQQGWRNEAALQEQQASHRVLDRGAVLDEHACPLSPLQAGDAVTVQNLDGNTPRKWTKKTGIVVESHPYDSYSVTLDGSHHVMRRNWQFLRPIHPDGEAQQACSPPLLLPSTEPAASRILKPPQAPSRPPLRTCSLPCPKE